MIKHSVINQLSPLMKGIVMFCFLSRVYVFIINSATCRPIWKHGTHRPSIQVSTVEVPSHLETRHSQTLCQVIVDKVASYSNNGTHRTGLQITADMVNPVSPCRRECNYKYKYFVGKVSPGQTCPHMLNSIYSTQH